MEGRSKEDWLEAQGQRVTRSGTRPRQGKVSDARSEQWKAQHFVEEEVKERDPNGGKLVRGWILGNFLKFPAQAFGKEVRQTWVPGDLSGHPGPQSCSGEYRVLWLRIVSY